MALSAGTRLGPYEIEAPLGAGGMGEVYRATDTRLDRTVAVKVLPEHVSGTPHLQQRLEREARALAGFSHPHICTLHDVGREQGVRFLVMELLEGETLAARLRRGALPIDEVVSTGIAIADALDAAHRRGVVHRDVKPGNVMLTKTGVKLLDFGLARDTNRLAPGSATGSSVTATRHPPITAEGTMVGTLSYMAPEQLEGQEADARSDLFSLGAVLYEMTTGAPPFRGNSQAGRIAAILTGEPAPVATLRPATPRALTRAVDRCLAKDPEERWQSARDLMLELQWIAEDGSLDDTPALETTRGRWRDRIAWFLVLALLAVVAVLATLRPDRRRGDASVKRLSLALPAGASGTFSRISPDGRTLVLSVAAEGRRQLWLRPLDSVSSRPLPGTDGALFPFWSPDSRHIGFFADGALKKVDVRGSPLQVLCEAPGTFSMGTWSTNGTIVFNVLEGPGYEGVHRVPDTGGTATRMTIRGESDEELFCAWPWFFPDGRHLLLSCAEMADGEPVNPGFYVVALDTGRARVVMHVRSERGFRAEYVAPGYLVFTREGFLMAQAFDASEFVVRGEPITIAERIEGHGPAGLDNFSASSDALVYQTLDVRSELILKDRNGRSVGRVGPPGAYEYVSLGPDGRELAVALRDPQTDESDVWIIELDRDVATRFTSGPADDVSALWSPDGRQIVFSSAHEAPPFMHVKSVANGDERVLLPSRGTMQVATGWSPDGRHILYGDRDPNTGWDVWILSLGDQETVPFLQTPFNELGASFSPDGHWVAYASDESGQLEVYVTPSPGPGKKRRISTDGGYLPYWRRDGNELFYMTLDGRVMAADVKPGPSFESEVPVTLFSIEPGKDAFRPYDVSPEGLRFVVISAIPETAGTPTVVIDWLAELAR